jgi:hypothetical protein
MRRVAASKRFIVLWSIALAACAQMMGAHANESDRTVSGFGIIDRVVASGSEPVFRADGYIFRVSAVTKVRFSYGLKTLSEVGTNTLARFDGKLDGAGVVVAAKVEFARLKLPKHKAEPADLQVTTFPQGSKIDAYSGFSSDGAKLAQEDKGGWCGWYSVSLDAALQQRVRQIGMQVVPQYQRDLPADDRAKIPFRFYVVNEEFQHSAIFCNNGLILLPTLVVERLPSDGLLAAALAEAVAGVLQKQAEDGRRFNRKDAAMLGILAAGAAAGTIPGAAISTGGVIERQIGKRSLMRARGRMSLALMADAGFDPHLAPEAWRLLEPGRLPKDPAKLKDTWLSQYLSDFLRVQDNPAATSGIATPQSETRETATPVSPDAALRP